MRRADGSGAQDHLAAGSDVDDSAVLEQLHASGAVLSRGPGAATLILVDVIIDQQLHCLSVGVDGEVGSMGDGMQERVGHRPATAAPLVDVEVRAAGVVSSVE